jgi:hypothetical protein
MDDGLHEKANVVLKGTNMYALKWSTYHDVVFIIGSRQ